MEEQYRFEKIEPKWQTYWEQTKRFCAEVDRNREKYYTLSMYPYPSGSLHMGHIFNYTISDVFAHVKRMQGYNVLHPMGWDAFGMPAENAAKERDVHPGDWTYKNIDAMRAQFKKFGFSFDWERELATCHPGYYHWCQWIFLKLWEKGLAYKQAAPVNWSESQQTVLANEQVIDGKDWRTGEEVIQKFLDQYYIKITHYAEELLQYLDKLPGWQDKVINEQRNWIGKSEGVLVIFKLDGEDFPIFTTRPDTIYGVTFMCIAPEHPLVAKMISDAPNGKEIKTFVDTVCKESTRMRTAETTEKLGYDTGKVVINPLNGDEIPLYIANFVLYEYGTGALMSVPAHDQRDFEFAKKYNLPIKIVIQNKDQSLVAKTMEAAFTQAGINVNSGPFDGKPNNQTIAEIGAYIEEQGMGSRTVNFKIRDWLISRQRYWGCPIPIAYDEHNTAHPVEEKDLPITLPMDVDFRSKGNPLNSSTSFKTTPNGFLRETDTMDTFVDSSWYFLRFCSPRNAERIFNPDEVAYWMPVDQYVGGIEHARGHLIYARFLTKALRDLGLVKLDEPFTNLLTQGMVNNKTYYSPSRRIYLWDHELGGDKTKDPKTGEQLIIRTEKMSKSKNNGVSPDEMLEKYGADAIRLFCLFSSPPEKDVDWGEDKVEGTFRFLKRIYRLIHIHLKPLKNASLEQLDQIEISEEQTRLRQKTHQTIKKVTHEFTERNHFNTGIAALMELYNEISDFKPSSNEDFQILKEAVVALIRCLFPICPHITEELHEQLGFKPSILDYGWLSYDDSLTIEDTQEMVFQVNGKVRSKETLPKSISKEELEKRSTEDPKVQKFLEGKQVIKIIVVPGKLVNIVVK